MSIETRVANALKRCPVLRDDVHLLTALFWKTDLKQAGRNMEKTTAKELLEFIAEDQILTSFKSIDRFWRKVQKENPELRGTDWGKRTSIDEPDVREQLSPHNTSP